MPRSGAEEEEDTLLHWAATNGHLHVIAQFCPRMVTAEALTECQDRKGETPLHRAAFKGHLGQVREVCPEALTPESFRMRDKKGATMLHHAADGGHLAEFQACCPAAWTPEAFLIPDNEGLTALHDAVATDQIDQVPPIDPANLPEDLRDHPVLNVKWGAHQAREQPGAAPPPAGADVEIDLV